MVQAVFHSQHILDRLPNNCIKYMNIRLVPPEIRREVKLTLFQKNLLIKRPVLLWLTKQSLKYSVDV